MSATPPKVLIVGDTPRWIQGVRKTLPNECDVYTCLDFVAAMQALFMDDMNFDLCIVANKLTEEDEGLHILQELRDDGRTNPFIVYSQSVSVVTQEKVTALGGIVITPKDITQPSLELKETVTELFVT